MTLFVIYQNPSDFPGKFVVRKWEEKVADQEPTAVVETLEAAREAVPKWAHFCLKRDPKDDPCIVETWL